MIKIICDRCKKEMKIRHYVRVTTFDDNDFLEHLYDICDECAEKVVNFIADYEITKADEYKKGYEDGFKEGKEEAWMDSMRDNL